MLIFYKLLSLHQSNNDTPLVDDFSWLGIGGVILATLYIFFSDIVYRKIPNTSVAFVWSFAILLMVNNENYSSIYITLFMLIIGWALHVMRVFGGGDIKLLLAYSVAIKPELALLYIVITLLLGGVLAIFYWVCHRMFGNVVNLKVGLPYGIPIGMSGIFCITASIA